MPASPLGERKYAAGVAGLFEWVAPDPLSAAPVLTVHMVAGDVAIGAMTVVSSPLTVTAVSGSDRRTLTTTEAAPDAGLPTRYGDAWLMTEEEGAIPVTVASLSALQVVLTEPLPRDVTLDATASLVWQTYTAALPLASVTTAVARDVRWSIAYVPSWGGDAPTSGATVATGLLHVVHQPFATRVTHQDMAAHMRTIGGMVPRNQQDLGPQIRMGEEELILWLRSQLAELDLTEDDVPAPQSLRMAHLYFSAACYHDLTDQEKATALRERAIGLATMATKRIWVDANQDGEMDDGEQDKKLTGGRSADVSHSAKGTTVSRTFSRTGYF